MKKYLIATTALVMTAGAAAAEVKISGDARFGIQYNDAGFANGSKTALEKRMNVTVDGSTTADNGVTFGARVRMRSNEGIRNGASPSTINGARVFARTGGLEVAAGNITGAIEAMPNLYGPTVGLTGLTYGGMVTNSSNGFWGWDAYASDANGAEGIEVIYTMGDFTGHLSFSSADLARNGNASADTRRVAAYGAYTFSGWTVALGLQDSDIDSNDKVVLTASGKVGDFGIGLGIAQNGKNTSKVNKIALNGSYTMGATTVSAYVSNESGHGAAIAVPASKSAYGLGVSYNMGGGASIVGGIERTTGKVTVADLGVSFKF